MGSAHFLQAELQVKLGVSDVSRISTTLKGLLAVAAAAGALAISAPASAITLVSASMDTSNTAVISGSGYSTVNAYIGPVTFHAKDGATEFDFTAYCVDIYHDMYLGVLNDPNGYDYKYVSLKTDSKSSTSGGQDGNLLSNLQLTEIASLLNLSVLLTKANVADLGLKRAGIQGAIWEIENPNITVTGSDVVNDYIYHYKAHAVADPLSANEIHAVFADDFGHQAFAFANGVPEPATWTMMILGFGAMGGVLRRRRQAPALPALCREPMNSEQQKKPRRRR